MSKQDVEFEMFEQRVWQAEDDMRAALEGFLAVAQAMCKKSVAHCAKVAEKSLKLREKCDAMGRAYKKTATSSIKKKSQAAEEMYCQSLQDLDDADAESEAALADLDYYTSFMEYVERREACIREFDADWHEEQEGKALEAGEAEALTDIQQPRQREVVVLTDESLKLSPKYNKL